MDSVLPAPSTAKQPAEAFIVDHDGDVYDDGRDSHADRLIVEPENPVTAQIAQFELAMGMLGSEAMSERFMEHVLHVAFADAVPPLLFFLMEPGDRLDEEDIHDVEACFFNGETHAPGGIEQTIIDGREMIRIRGAVDWRTQVTIGRRAPLKLAAAGYNEQMLLPFAT